MAKTLASTATFDLVRDQVITASLHLCGVLHADHVPDAGQLKVGTRLLSMGLMSLQADGVILRLLDDYEQAITAGTAEYAAASDTMNVEGSGHYVTSTDGFDHPLSMMQRNQHNGISDKSLQGTPAQLYVRDSVTGPTLVLYPVPDSNWTSFTYLRTRKIRDVSSGNVHLDIPDKFIDAVTLNLAYKWALHYNKDGKAKTLYELYKLEAEKVVSDETPRGPMRLRLAPIISRGDH